MIWPAMDVLLLVAIATVVVLVVMGVLSRRAARRGAGGAGGSVPRCGLCGYDTTGLAQLTCPECGADLRAAGILTAHTAHAYRGFAAAAVTLVGAWIVCGVVLASVVSPLLPPHRRFEQDVRMSGPASGAYGAVVIKSAGAWWGEGPSVSRVRLELERPATGANAASRPLQVNARTGGYEYVDAAGRRVTEASGFGEAAILAWLADAGVGADNDKVRSEARAVYLGVRRAVRARRAVPRMNTGAGHTSLISGGSDQPFSSTRATESSSAHQPVWVMPALGFAWLAVAAAGLTYVWKSTRRAATPEP